MILEASNENVGLVQELCYKICEHYSIWKTQEKQIEIGSIPVVMEVVNSITNESKGMLDWSKTVTSFKSRGTGIDICFTLFLSTFEIRSYPLLPGKSLTV